jgi:hypothetical protein
MSITQPVSAFVALGIQHAMCLHHIICDLSRSTTFFRAAFSKKRVLNVKTFVDFLYNVCLKYFSH